MGRLIVAKSSLVVRLTITKFSSVIYTTTEGSQYDTVFSTSEGSFLTSYLSHWFGYFLLCCSFPVPFGVGRSRPQSDLDFSAIFIHLVYTSKGNSIQ